MIGLFSHLPYLFLFFLSLSLSLPSMCATLCFIFLRSDYECFQIELSKNYGNAEWREDLKSIMMKAGLLNVQITFLFVDTQVSYIYSSDHAFHAICFTAIRK